MKTIFSRFFLIVLLLSSSCFFVFSDAALKAKAWSFTKDPTPKNMPWLSKKSTKNIGKYGVSYFYVAPGYEGSQWASLFWPLHLQRHHLWWDSGSILLGSSAGYRYVLKKPYFNQNCFLGVYFSHAYHGKCEVDRRVKDFHRESFGLEIGGARFGQFTLSRYWILGNTLKGSLKRLRTYDCYKGRFRGQSYLVDNSGISAKWISIPNTWGVQKSIVLAYTCLQSKLHNTSEYFSPEYVFRLGAGCEFNLNSWVHIEVQWMLIDKYKSISLIPSFGIKLIGAKPHFAKDTFQGRLLRPPQYHVPLYAHFEWDDCLVKVYNLFRKPKRQVEREEFSSVYIHFDETLPNFPLINAFYVNPSLSTSSLSSFHL